MRKPQASLTLPLWGAVAFVVLAPAQDVFNARSDVPPGLVLDPRISTLDFFSILEEMSARSYLGDFELMVLLALIRLGEDAYGVPISREIERQSGREVALGTVYAALERLEQKGLVTSELGDSTPERGGRAKRYFHITKAGLSDVREARRTLINLWRGLSA